MRIILRARFHGWRDMRLEQGKELVKVVAHGW